MSQGWKTRKGLKIWSVLVATVVAGTCAVAAGGESALRERPAISKPKQTVLTEKDRRDVIQVKFRDSLKIRLREGRLTDFDDGSLAAAQPLLDLVRDGRWQRLTTTSEEQLDALRLAAEQNLGRRIADMNLDYFLHLPADADATAVIDAFNALDIVELAQPVPMPPPLPVPGDFQSSQGYLNAPPAGVDAYFCWSDLLTRGAGVRLVDIEYAFNANHLDLPPVTILGPTPQSPFGDNNHGTAVLGEIASIDNGWGTTGIAPDAALHFAGAYTHNTWNPAGAILAAIPFLDPGDVILIEQQWW